MTNPTPQPPDPADALERIVRGLAEMVTEWADTVLPELQRIFASIGHPLPPSRRLTRMHTAYRRRHVRNHRRRRP